MSVQVGTQYPATTAANYSTTAKTDSGEATEEAKKSGGNTQAETPKKETYKPDLEKINQMKADLSSNTLAFKQMVYSMIKTQGGYANSAMSSLLNIDKITQSEAQQAISEDGEWGVNKTAARILDFAKALSGDDPEKAEMLRDAVNKGFAATEKLWGGNLPQICYDTREKIMQGFDDWIKSGKSTEAAAAVTAE